MVFSEITGFGNYCILRPETLQMQTTRVCEYSSSRSFHDDFILQDQASGERSQNQWSSGFVSIICSLFAYIVQQVYDIHQDNKMNLNISTYIKRDTTCKVFYSKFIQCAKINILAMCVCVCVCV